LTEPVSEGRDCVCSISYQLTLGLSAVVLLPLAVAQSRWDLALAVLVGDALGHAGAGDVGNLCRGITKGNAEHGARLGRRRSHLDRGHSSRWRADV
jgi:hypothetical protein